MPRKNYRSTNTICQAVGIHATPHNCAFLSGVAARAVELTITVDEAAAFQPLRHNQISFFCL